jgi:hypothetical protein
MGVLVGAVVAVASGVLLGAGVLVEVEAAVGLAGTLVGATGV